MALDPIATTILPTAQVQWRTKAEMSDFDQLRQTLCEPIARAAGRFSSWFLPEDKRPDVLIAFDPTDATMSARVLQTELSIVNSRKVAMIEAQCRARSTNGQADRRAQEVDDNKEMRHNLSTLEHCCTLIVLLTPNVLFSPECLVTIFRAIALGINIVPINIEYDFASSKRHLQDLAQQMPA